MKLVLGFSTTNGLHSKLIRWFTKANISHTYFRLYDKTLGVEMVLHSDMPGVVFTLADDFKIKNFTLEEYEIDDERLDSAVKNNLWFLGRKYDYYKLFDWAWAILLRRWFVRKIKNPITNPKKIICTDFVLFILNEAGLTHLPIGHLLPLDLQEWCRENYESLGWTRKVFDDTPKWLK